MTLLPIHEGGVTVTADYSSFFHLSQSIASLPNKLRYNDLVKAKKGPIPVLDFISNAEIDGQRGAGEVLTQVGMRRARRAMPSLLVRPVSSSFRRRTKRLTRSRPAAALSTKYRLLAAVRTRRILIFQAPKVPIH